MNRGRFISASCVLALFLLFASPIQAETWKDRWKFGTLAPNGVGWARGIKEIVIPAVDKATDGNLDVKVYWGGVMGDDEDYIKKIRIGQLNGAGFSGQGVTLAVKEMAVVELPFLFNNYEEVDFIKKEMSGTFDEIAEKNGFMSIAWIDEDFHRVYSKSFSMTKLKDFESSKVLSWFGPIEETLLESLNASPVGVNMPEAPPALRQGVGDSIIASAAWVLGAQLYSNIQFISPYAIRYAPAMIAVSWDSWAAMPEDYRKRYFSIRPDVIGRFVKQVRADNAKSIQAMQDYGVKVVDVDEADLAAIREKTVASWRDNVDVLYPEELLDEVLDNLAGFRNQ